MNLAPTVDLPEALQQAKARSRKLIANELATLVPSRLADAWAQREADWQRPTERLLTRPWPSWPSNWPLGADTHRHRGLQRPR